MWAGQGFGLVKKIQPAAGIVREIAAPRIVLGKNLANLLGKALVAGLRPRLVIAFSQLLQIGARASFR
jgi:hypothetical protein